MRVASIQINGDSWIEFPLYEIIKYNFGFYHHGREYELESVLRLDNDSEFEIVTSLTDSDFLIRKKCSDRLIEELVEFSDFTNSHHLFFWISELIWNGAIHWPGNRLRYQFPFLAEMELKYPGENDNCADENWINYINNEPGPDGGRYLVIKNYRYHLKLKRVLTDWEIISYRDIGPFDL